VWLYYGLLATSVTPIGTASGDIVSYILGYGVCGIAVVLFALGYIVPKPVKDSAVAAARADVVAENERLRAALTRAEEQRDEALKIAQTQLVPLLSQFTATSSGLIPLLQELVRSREVGRGRDSGQLR